MAHAACKPAGSPHRGPSRRDPGLARRLVFHASRRGRRGESRRDRADDAAAVGGPLRVRGRAGPRARRGRERLRPLPPGRDTQRRHHGAVHPRAAVGFRADRRRRRPGRTEAAPQRAPQPAPRRRLAARHVHRAGRSHVRQPADRVADRIPRRGVAARAGSMAECAAPRRSRPCDRALRRRGRRARELRLRLPAGRPGRALCLGA